MFALFTISQFAIMVHPNLVIRSPLYTDLEAILDLIYLKAEFDGCPNSVTATIAQLEKDLFAEPPLSYVLLAEIEENIIGFATYHRIYSTFLAKPGLWLDDLYLKPEFRGQGIGRSLLSYLCKVAQEMGCARIDWTVDINNDRGIGFYQSIGAKINDQVRMCRLDEAAIAQNI